MKLFLLVGSIFAALSILFGAFGAHFLKEKLSSDQLVVFETIPLNTNVFEDLQEKAEILPVNRITYDPDFWEGYMIIEPNAAIKEFRVK